MVTRLCVLVVALAVGAPCLGADWGAAQAAYAAGDYVAAVTELETLVADEPELAPAHSLLGDARSALGNLVGAFEAYAEAARLDPADAAASRAAARAAMGIANTLAETSDRGLWYGWAAEYAERAAAASGLAEDAVVVGDALLGAGDAARAREWLQRAVAGGGGPVADYLLGRALADADELEGAVEALSRAVAGTEDGALRQAIGYSLVQVHERARSFTAAEQVASALGDAGRVAEVRAVAAALAGAGDDPRVEPCFARWVALQGEREDARRHQATPAWAALETRQAELLGECGEPLGLSGP